MARPPRAVASNSMDALRNAGNIAGYVHADYAYHKPDWDLLRDVMAGERRIKEMGQIYLPPLGKDSGTPYENYKDRATFVNMIARTASGLVGTVFRRSPKLFEVSEKTRDAMQRVSREGISLSLYAKTIMKEIVSMGRVGILVDRAGPSTPYFTTYLAENILSWSTTMRDGVEILSYVLLREIVDNSASMVPSNGTSSLLAGARSLSPALIANYRILRLDAEGKYVQEFYATGLDGHGNPVTPNSPTTTIVPMRNGAPLDEIPFVILGPDGPTAGIQRSPLLDIATLNIAHYRASAQLEHGRFFTALPVYYVQRNAGSTEQNEYVVGPSVVWEVGNGEKPGILEFYGSGLASLTQSLVEKEEAISQLGGRVMGIRSSGSTESDLIYQLKQANEMSVLINITDSMGEAFTKLLRIWLMWENKDDEAKTARVVFNQDFKALNIGARELRALMTLYQAGVLPIAEVYRVLQESEFIADDVTLDEFMGMLSDPDQFPNQPDVDAKMSGYPDALSQLSEDEAATQREHEDKLSKREVGLEKELQRNDLRAKKAMEQARGQTASGADAARTRTFDTATNKAGTGRKPKAK